MTRLRVGLGCAIALLLGGAAAWPFAARGQLPEGARHIGVLMGLAEDAITWRGKVVKLREHTMNFGVGKPHRPAARAFFPLRPSATAAGSFPSS